MKILTCELCLAEFESAGATSLTQCELCLWPKSDKSPFLPAVVSTLLVIMATLFPANALAFEQDKLLHFSASAGIQMGCSLAMTKFLKLEKDEMWTSRIGCAVFTLAVGLAKEHMDAMQTGRNNIDGADMTANALGVGSGVLLGWAFEF